MFISNRKWSALLFFGVMTLFPGVVQAQYSLTSEGFSGVGAAVVQRDSGGTGVASQVSANVGGASAGGVLTGGGYELVASAGFRLTTRLAQVQEFDTDGDGNIDQAAFTYEAPVLSATAADLYTVAGQLGDSIQSLSADGKTVTVAVLNVTGTDRKTARYSARDGVMTDGFGNPVIHWPAPAGRRASQVEQDRAAPVATITDPGPLALISGVFPMSFTSSESLKASVTLTAVRVRGKADAGSPHPTSGTQTADSSVNVDTSMLNLVEGAGYRIEMAMSDKADEGDPGTATPNAGQTEVWDLIYTGQGTGFRYVSSTNGNDASGDGSPGNPYRTLGRGLQDVARAGGNVFALPGFYSGESFPLSLPSGVTLRAAGADVTEIQGNSGCGVLFQDAMGSELVGFTVKNAGRSSPVDFLEDSAVCLYGGSDNLVHNNILRSNRSGVRIEESDPQVFLNTIVQGDVHGVTLRYPDTAATSVTNNVIADNSGTCVYYEIAEADAPDAGNLVFGNTLFPGGCGSTTSGSSLSGNNTEADPQLDENYIAQNPASSGMGWNHGDEGTEQNQNVPPPAVRAMDGLGFLLAILTAVIVAGFVLRRRRGNGKDPRPRA